MRKINDTDHPSAFRPVTELFKEQARLHPEKTAVTACRESLSYAELDRRANRVANSLIRRGAKAETIVGVLLSRSCSVSIARQGILRSGAAFVSIAPDYPDDRIRYIMEDSGARFMITTQKIRDRYAALLDSLDCQTLLLEDLLQDGAETDPDCTIGEHDLCYCIYTSGSTGRPKGVMIEHGNLANFVDANEKNHETLGFTQRAHVCLALAAITFDVSIMEEFIPLTNGLTMVMANEEEIENPQMLAGLIRENGVDCMVTTPSFISSLLDLPQAAQALSQIAVYDIGAEAFPAGLYDKITAIRPDAYIMNGYGPTETTISCTMKVIEGNEGITIGRPNANVKAYIIDEDGKPVPDGEIGELLICGKGVGRGYINLPEKTAEAFIDFHGERGYRTGDLARINADGEIEFRGRADNQIKLRGLRIELGEIEEVINSFPGVKTSITLPIDDSYLCGYFTADQTVDTEELDGYLSRYLPYYMVPDILMQLDDMPLTDNMKIDKRALPRPSFIQKEIEAPKSPTQQKIYDIVASVTGNRTFGIHTNLYRAGLTSLGAMRLNLLLSEAFGVTAKTSDIYEHNTVVLLEQFLADAPRDITHEKRDIYPLTGSQKGIFAECSKNPDSTIYNIPFLFRLEESVDIDQLSAALRAVIQAHPYLLTRVGVSETGEIYQRPCTEDMEDLTPECIELSAKDLAEKKKDLVRPFTLQGERLFRMEIYALPNGQKYLFIDLHHIIADGNSYDIFFRDLDAAYRGNALTAEKHTGFDAALDEEEAMENGRYQKAALYYDKVFAGIDTESLPLPDKKGSAPAKGLSSRTLAIPQEQILSFCEKLQVTPNTLFTGLFGVVMARYAGTEETLFATIYNGRNDPRLADTICMLVKTLPVYCRFDKKTTVSAYMTAFQSQMMDSMANDIFPFSDIAAKYGITSDLIFAYQAELADDFPLGDTTVRGEDLSLDMPKEPLVIQVRLYDGKYVLTAEYRADLYEKATIDRIMEAYETAMGSMMKSRYISEISLLSPGQEQILDSFQATEIPFDRSKTVVDMFRDMADRYPDRTAVVYRGTEISYRELDEISDRIGAYLMEKGLKAEDPVAILIPRCADMVLMSLGVLKAGCAYQPLDPTYPRERLQFMLEDSRASLLIADESMLSLVPEYAGQVLLTSTAKKLPTAKQPLPTARPEDLFVLLYTSGSTGVPKGCMLEYGNITAFCRWYHRYYAMTPDCHVAAYASFGFDASMMDIFATITCGAALYIIPEDMRLDFLALNRYFEENEITNSFMTTQVGRQFAVGMENHSLKHLSVGGEKLVSMDPPKGYAFHNLYGPTECTVAVTALTLDKYHENIPIGRSLDNVKLYIADPQGHRLPVGACGELLISGLQVGRGYLRQPEKTREAFSANPYTQEADYSRLYHTGDMVRWLPDGSIEFVGRRDAQVKIRGFRIELAEIEEVIRRFPGIADATVAAFDEAGGGKYIAAYIVSAQAIDVDALNRFILETKPPYMVPAVTMQIDQIPLNQNQKVNRRALPRPEKKPEELIPPKTDIQKRILDCVAEAIGHQELGITTDIYDAGLTSISAIRLNVLLANAFDITMKTTDLKDHRTVQELERLILHSGTAQNDKTREIQEVYPLTNTQTGVFVDCSANMGTTIYNIPYLLKLGDKIDIHRLKTAIEQTIQAHPYLNVQLFTDERGRTWQRRDDELPPRVEMVSGLDMEDLVRPFGLFDQPLYRFQIHTTAEGNYLFIDLHHLIADGTSMDLLISQINQAYSGQSLPKETYTSYDAALDNAAAVQSDAYARAAEVYRKEFEGCDGDTYFYPDKKEDAPSVGNVRFRDEDLTTERVRAFCEKYQITENVFFIGAFGILLSRYNFKDEAVFTTVYHGRGDSRLADTVGMLVKTLPVRCRMAGDLEGYFTGLRQQLMDAMDADIYPFAEISRQYEILPNAMIAYQGDQFVFDHIGEEEAREIPLHLDTAKSPVTLFVSIEKNQFVFEIEYRADMYEEATIYRILEAYRTAIASIMEIGSNRCVTEISILSQEQEQILNSFLATEVPYDRSRTVVDMFRETAAAHPDHVAVVYQDTKISYRELDAISERIGLYLMEKGLKAEDPVAILIPRCADMVLMTLGVLKAGCAYQPLDPTYPRERLQFMLEDSRASLLIADESMLSLVPDYDGEILLTSTARALEGSAQAKALPAPRPEDLFVLLYTSGSTGVPKGCMLEYGNITAFCRWYHRYYGMTPESRTAAYASFGFDASMMDIFCTITCGATLYIIPEDMRLDFLELDRYFEENQITNSFMTTQVGRQFALGMEGRTLSHLSVGGEKLVSMDPPEHFQFHNIYGPTECTVAVTAMALDRYYENIPIGRSLDNVKLYIADTQGHRLPVGACGELLISGLQVGRGYLRQPEKTREAFSDNPYTQKAGYTRLYHTGDVVRWLPDGSIEFVGRKDAQVKIRGFRIELTEVEEVIRRFPGITDATVAAFDESNGGKYIAAYVVSEQAVDTDALNRFILETKPPYMVPAVTMQIDQIPLNQNQKVNKRALPKPEKRPEELIPPENDTQKRILDCVAEAIGHRELGITTDIYDAGLTSISAIRLNVLLANTFDITMKTTDLKEHRTIRQLEQFILHSEGTGIPKTHEIQEVYPLTNTQAGVFIDCTANMGTTVYNIPYLLKLGDKIDIGRLKTAIEQTIQAHPYLNVQLFMDEDGEIRQRRDDALPPQVTIVPDLIMDELVQPFGLFNEPLYRFQIHTSVEGNYLFIDLHHLIADGTSLDILIDQINRAYSGEELSKEAYTSYDAALDNATALSSGAYDRAAAVYQKEFEGCGGDTYFYPDKQEETPAVGNLRFVDGDLTAERVHVFCEKFGITENVFFIGAFGILLSKYNFKEEVVFTTIYHGRGDSRLTETVGMLVKTLPVRCRMDGDLEHYFTALREQLMDSMDADIYPFTEISRQYQILPNAMLVYQGDQFVFNRIGEEEAQEIPLYLNAAKAPVSLSIGIEKGRFVYDLEYRADMFEESTIQYILENFSLTTGGLIQEKTADQIQLLFEEDKEMFDDPLYTGKTFVDLFARAVKLHPHRPAVRDAQDTLTYEELDRASHRVAVRLAQTGFGPEKVAGLLTGRTKEFVIGFIGIMKAGGAYVPLDPEYPQDRIAYMLSDSGAEHLLMVKDYENLKGSYRGNILWLDGLDADPDPTKAGAVVPALTAPKPENLAYMIYTSGSTGKPKGVMLEHRNLSNLMLHEARFLRLTPEDIVAEFASFCFDASVHDLFVPLTTGSLLYIFPEEIRKDALQVADTIQKEAITVVTFPTQMGELVAEILTDPCSLRFMTLGGEKFKRYYNRDYKMINGYGPTENTVSSTEFLVDKDYRNIPIGKSQINVRSYVVDEKMQRVPVGASGELCHAGRQIARGYHNLPEKTAAAFIENPFATCADDARMYRTGDMVRMRGDGNLEYIGRIDSQVKIRGYRVELGEIEGALLAYKGVQEASVTVAEKNGNKYIAAYYTGADPDPETWRGFLNPLLPEYMLPAFYTHLEKMPVTPGGKIDKRALPAPKIQTEEKDYEPPTNSTQRALCEMFEKALGMEPVGIDDNFFELGGTSLTASKIAVLCLTKDLPIVYADIFKYPTVRQLAALVCADSVEETENSDEISGYDYDPIRYVLLPNRAKNADLVVKEDIGDILLTGATGFLGIHVLKEYLDHYPGTAYCLVRKGSYPTSEKRLMNMLMYYFDNPHQDAFGGRIVCIDGDITEAASVESLSRYPFRTLINCAACVKHFAADDTLERINVEGVKNLIALCRGQERRLIQISTVSVAGEGMGDRPGMTKELGEDELYIGQRITNEYIRTKFLAERYVLEAVINGLDAKIIRVGNLMSRDSDGEFQINFITNGFLRGVRGYAAVGAFPMSGMNESAEFSPIDSTAAAILKLSGTDKRFTVYHACNSHKIFMGDLIYAMKDHGFDIEVIDDAGFAARVDAYAAENEDSDAVSGLIAYSSRDEDAIYTIGYDDRFSTEVLYRLGYKWPITDDDYLEHAIDALDGLGFFE